MSFIPQQETNMSTALMLADLDDFLPISRQECIKPFLLNSSDNATTGSTSNISEEGGVALNETRTTRRNNRLTKKPGTVGQEPKKIAKIELADCLACSGCVTTAESVLVNQQSIDQFLSSLREMDLVNTLKNHFSESNTNKQPIVGGDDLDSLLQPGNFSLKKPTLFFVTISQQSAASLASFYQCSSVQECLNRLSYLFKVKFGAAAVFEIASLARLVSHLEICEEFVRKFKENGGKSPLFTSACPGWICYAEKTHPEILPFISTVKSPQQIMGTLVKKFISNNFKDMTNVMNVYHVTVMPCFDKKLEASRPDFTNDPFDKVDMVLTSSEITELLQRECQIESSEDFHNKTMLNSESFTDNVLDILKNIKTTSPSNSMDLQLDENLLQWLDSSSDATGSGAYCEMVFKYAAKKLFNIDIRHTTLNFESKRNSDYREVVLYDPKCSEPTVLLKFVIANGFRNIQNLVRRMKQVNGDESFHFVEVMACPIGCLNGGGQVKVKNPKGDSSSDPILSTTPKQHLSQTDKLYREDVTYWHNKEENLPSLVQALYELWIQGPIGSNSANKILHTKYHAVEKLNMLAPTALKW